MSIVGSDVPPVPPPPALLGRQTKTSFRGGHQIQLSECGWALNFPDVQKALFLARVSCLSAPKCWRLKNIPSILQNGPTCGLTAVSMIFNGQPTTDEILDIAKDRNYTRNGEMFSAKNLYRLICDIAAEKDKSIECQLHEGQLDCAKVKESVKSGSCIFVPYDPDFNHGPCLKMGHKAHWALIIGYLIDKEDKFYVFSRHGKSRNIAVWSLKELSDSNANLVEFAQPKGYPNVEFLLPEGGLGGQLGLRNQSIIVDGIKANETVIVE